MYKLLLLLFCTVPEPPESLVVNTDANSITLLWSGGDGANGFRITYTSSAGPRQEYGIVYGSTFVTITKLEANTQYRIEIYSVVVTPEGYAESTPASVTATTGK